LKKSFHTIAAGTAAGGAAGAGGAGAAGGAGGSATPKSTNFIYQ